jgi:hypothetical protein
VVHNPEASETSLVCSPADLCQLGTYPLGTLRPGEARNL